MIRQLFSRLSRRLILGLVPGLLLMSVSGAHPAYATFVADIKNFDTKCLAEENVGPVIDTCHDTLDRQDWKIVNVPNDTNDNLIRNDLTGDCLSIRNNDISAGAQVNTFTCDFTGGNQFELWFVRAVDVIDHVTYDEIGNRGDFNARSDLVMHPSGCGASNDVGIFMNVPFQCNADDWTPPSTTPS